MNTEENHRESFEQAIKEIEELYARRRRKEDARAENARKEREAYRQNLEQEIKELGEREVKIAVIGQRGAGKSSLINTLLGEDVTAAGEVTDTTAEARTISFRGLKITELSEYGMEQISFEETIDKFALDEYDLYLFVFSDKLSDHDNRLMEYMKKWHEMNLSPFFIVRNKIDELYRQSKTREEIESKLENDIKLKLAEPTQKIFFTSCKNGEGMEALTQAIFESELPKIKRKKLQIEFQARTLDDLVNKTDICERFLKHYIITASESGLLPVPGVDVAAYISLIRTMFAQFRDIFQLNKKDIADDLYNYPIVQKILAHETPEGIAFLLKKAGEEELSMRCSIGMMLCYELKPYHELALCVTRKIGNKYISDCRKLAKKLLKRRTRHYKRLCKK